MYENNMHETCPRPPRYVGTYRNGVKEGHGVMTWPNGNVYTGQWRDNKYEGKGTFTFGEGGIKFTGTWAHGEMIKGHYDYPNGSVIQFEKGKKSMFS